MKKQNSAFYEKYIGSSGETTKRLRIHWKIFFILLILGTTFFSFYYISPSYNASGMDLFTKNIGKLFEFQNNDPNYPTDSILSNSISLMWSTIKFITLGTTLGFIFALFTSIFSSNFIFKKWVYIPVRGIIFFLRSFPALLFVYATQSGFEKEFAAALILFWFTWLWGNKYLVEIIQNANKHAYDVGLKNGLTKMQSLYRNVFFPNSNKILVTYIYGFESNLRWSTLLASVGLVGIGSLIDSNLPSNTQYIGIPLATILIVIIATELMIYLFNKFVFKAKNKEYADGILRKNHIINYRHIAKLLFIFTTITIGMVQLFTMEWNFNKVNGITDFIAAFFAPITSEWDSGNIDKNPWLMIFEVFFQSVISFWIAIAYSLIFSLTSSENILNKASLGFKFLNSFIRVIPKIALFYIFNPIFFSTYTTTAIVVGLYSGSACSKKIVESINKIPSHKIEKLKYKGWSKFQIIRYFIWPTIKKDVISYFAFMFENIFRSVIALGILGGSRLGSHMDQSIAKNNYAKMMGYAWPSMLAIASIAWASISIQRIISPKMSTNNNF